MLRTGRSQLQIDRLGGDLSMRAVGVLRQSDLNTPSWRGLCGSNTRLSSWRHSAHFSLTTYVMCVAESACQGLVFSATCGPMKPGDQVRNICLLRPGISRAIYATGCVKARLGSWAIFVLTNELLCRSGLLL